jgi:hypothetical protein
MSFKATFKAGAIEGTVLACSFNLHQETDSTGRPSSITRGGTIRLTVESTASTELFEWMCNSFERKDGAVTYYKRDSDATLKELKFTEGYLVSYDEQFQADGTAPFLITFSISAKEIKIGNGTHTNAWV